TVGWAKARSAHVSADPRCRAPVPTRSPLHMTQLLDARMGNGEDAVAHLHSLHSLKDSRYASQVISDAFSGTADSIRRSRVAKKPQAAAIRAETLDRELIVTGSARSVGRGATIRPRGTARLAAAGVAPAVTAPSSMGAALPIPTPTASPEARVAPVAPVSTTTAATAATAGSARNSRQPVPRSSTPARSREAMAARAELPSAL